jgi:H+/Cl- antiporter ClcA
MQEMMLACRARRRKLTAPAVAWLLGCLTGVCVVLAAGGCMRMTVATCVMLLELTNNLALLPLMMLVTLVAKV